MSKTVSPDTIKTAVSALTSIKAGDLPDRGKGVNPLADISAYLRGHGWDTVSSVARPAELKGSFALYSDSKGVPQAILADDARASLIRPFQYVSFTKTAKPSETADGQAKAGK